MRTTVTLDPDVAAFIKAAMREQGITFKQALNEAIRRAGGGASARPFRTPTFELGEPMISLDKALAIADQLEDEEVARKLAAGR